MSDSKSKRKTGASEEDLHSILNALVARTIPESEWTVALREAGDDAVKEALSIAQHWMVIFTKQSHVGRIFQVDAATGHVRRCLTECPQLMAIDPEWFGENDARASKDNAIELRTMCRDLTHDNAELTHPQMLGLLLRNGHIPCIAVTQPKLAVAECHWLSTNGQAWSLSEAPKDEIGRVVALKTSARSLPNTAEALLRYMQNAREALLKKLPHIACERPTGEPESTTVATTTTTKKGSSKKEKKKKEKKDKKKKKKRKHSSSSSSSSSSSDASPSVEESSLESEEKPPKKATKKRSATTAMDTPTATESGGTKKRATVAPLAVEETTMKRVDHFRFPSVNEPSSAATTSLMATLNASPLIPRTVKSAVVPEKKDTKRQSELEMIARYDRLSDWFNSYMSTRHATVH